MAPNKTTTPMTDAQLKALIARGVVDALAECNADRSRNGDDSHDSGTGGRRQAPPTQFHIKTVTHEVAYAMTWKTLKKMMTDKYFPRSEIKKLEIEMWNLKVKGTDVRKLDNNNQAQQQPPKKQDVAIAYTTGSGEEKKYAGTLPLCNKCKFYHNGQCTIKFANCKRVAHLTRDYRSSASTNNQRNLTCYECGNQGHYRSDCPELKNQNHGNQAGGTGARGMVHAL
ncbi:reverse transcriptase domain-containing protein [Tanacetum coccineum]